MTERKAFRTGPIELVREGMAVVDGAGEEIGTVAYVSMGDPEAATTAGNELRPPNDILTTLANAVADERPEPDAPEPARSRLIRHGFVKVDGPDLADTDRYVRADWIDAVVDGRVRLRVPRSRLPVED